MFDHKKGVKRVIFPNRPLLYLLKIAICEIIKTLLE